MTTIDESNKLPARVGLIGIGLVGEALVQLLRARKIEVLGYDLNPQRQQRFRELGGQSAGGPGEVAQGAEVVLLSLPDTCVVQEVLEGPGGILTAASLPACVIDTTTGDPGDSIRFACQLEQAGVSFLDATICGASSQLAQRQAVLMVGGERSAYAAWHDLWDLLASHVFYIGPAGSGAKAKLATNLVLGLNRLVLAEGLVFAEKLGLSLDTFVEILKVSPAYSAAVDIKGPKMLANDFEPVSRIHQHHKDVTLMLKHARQQNQHLPLAQLHLDILEGAMAAGDSELDTSAVIKEIRRRLVNPSDSLL